MVLFREQDEGTEAKLKSRSKSRRTKNSRTFSGLQGARKRFTRARRSVSVSIFLRSTVNPWYLKVAHIAGGNCYEAFRRERLRSKGKNMYLMALDIERIDYEDLDDPLALIKDYRKVHS